MKKLFVGAVACLAAVNLFAAMSDTVNITATVGLGSGSFLNIEPASVAFGTVNPSPAVHRFKSNVLTCEYYAANAPWSIAVTTANTNDLVGLVGRSGTNFYTLPFKFWQANFGGGSNPDPNVQTNWTGANPCFKWVFDNGTTPAMTLGSSASQDNSPIPFLFAIDAEAAFKTNYSSTVTLELVIE